jgi:hypothetical protein
LIFVPGPVFDRWIQLGRRLPGEEYRNRPNIESMLVVQKQDAQGRPLAKPKVRFVDYWRQYSDKSPSQSFYSSGPPSETGTKINLTPRLAVNGAAGGENCYQCHKSGVLPFNPEAGSVTSPKDLELVKSFNSRIASYGAPDLDGAVDTDAYGPPMGPPDRTRSDEFLDSCSMLAKSPTKAKSYEKIRNAMNCAMCHDGQQMGALNYPFGRNMYEMLLKSYVIDTGKMPPGHSDLTSDERKGLANCLSREYYGAPFDKTPTTGLFQDWIANKPACKLAAGSTNCDGTSAEGDCKDDLANRRSTKEPSLSDGVQEILKKNGSLVAPAQ